MLFFLLYINPNKPNQNLLLIILELFGNEYEIA